MYNISIFVERLKELIAEKEITQTQLAEGTGLTETSISQYVKGNCDPSLSSLVAIAEYFNCSVDYLIGAEEENTKKFLRCPPFPERIKELLKDNNLSGYKFCKQAKIPQGSFYDWKNGKTEPTLTNLIKIAEYFDCRVDYLLGRES